MAAPTLPEKSNNTVKKKKEKQPKKQDTGSVRKVSKKNILLPPFQLEWPEVEADVEERILEALVLKLKEFPRLEPERKRPGADTKEKGDTENNEDLERQRVRCQLAVGHRQVTKGLERDQLLLVLVWRDAKPPLLIRSLLPLATSRACPALCLKTLVPKITEVTGLSSLIAIGFKKNQPGLDDFGSFVTMAAELAPPLSVPWIKAGKAAVMNAKNHNAKNQKEKEEKTDDIPSNIDWPIMSGNEEKQLLEKLTGLLVPFKAVFKKPKPRFVSKEWKSQRKIIRDHLITDLVAIGDAARCGKLELLLVQSDANLQSPTLTSVVMAAARKGCPVLHLTFLRKQVTSVIRNPLLKALGFRSSKDPTCKQPKEFTEFIEFATKFISPDLQKLIPQTEDLAKETVLEEKADTKKTSKPQKTPVPFYDVSHLYVYKKDTSKVTEASSDSVTSEQNEAAAKKRKFVLSQKTETFISLSSEPTVQIIGPKPESDSSESASVYLDTKGNSLNKPTAKADSSKGKTSSTEKSARDSFEGVMGLDISDTSSAPVPFYPESGKSKGKANLKRKLSGSAASGDFLSFKLAPTNVQTSVSNPNKRKKEKKKKRR